MKRLKKLIRNFIRFVALKIILPLYYKINCLRPINKNLVLFADRHNREMADNFIGLYNMCKENGYKCEVLSGDLLKKDLPFKKRWKSTIKYYFKFMRLFAQCRTLFLVDYFPLAYIVKPRKGVDVVQLWHGCGLMKGFGYAVSGNAWGRSEKEMKKYPMHNTYTLATASSPKVREGYYLAYRCNKDIIKPLGSPRTDIYFDKEFVKKAKDKVKKLIPEIGNRKIILYAPTYRGKSMKKSYMDDNLDYKEMKKILSDKYVFLTKFHPLMAKEGFKESNRLVSQGFAFDVTKKLTPEEALCAAVKITKIRHALWGGLFADLVGIIAAVILTNLFF